MRTEYLFLCGRDYLFFRFYYYFVKVGDFGFLFNYSIRF